MSPGPGPRSEPPFRADHVGSLLRPPELLKARGAHAGGTIDIGQLRAVEDALAPWCLCSQAPP